MLKKRNIGKILRFIILFNVIIGFHLQGYSQYSIREIQFKGNSRTKSSYLNRFTTTRIGESLDSIKINNDLRKLRNLAPVMNAEALLAFSDSGLSLTYAIKERYTLLPVGDFGITKNNFWIGGGLMESNLAGKGMYIYGYYQYNSRHTMHFIFRNPYLFASKWGMELQLRNLPSIENYSSNSQILIKYFDLSLATRYEFQFENEITFGTSIRHEMADNSDLISLTEDTVIFIQRLNQVLFLKHEIQKLDFRYFYINGWKNRMYVSLQVPYNPENNSVVLVYDEFLYYTRIGLRSNLAVRILAGISNEKRKVFYPFFADSYYSFRGIGYRAFRGNAIGLLNLEYRYTCFENPIAGIQLVAFSDAGCIPQIPELSDNSNNYRPDQIFSGIGIRFIYKKAYNAILTIDYGYDMLYWDKGGLVIGWGQYF